MKVYVSPPPRVRGNWSSEPFWNLLEQLSKWGHGDYFLCSNVSEFSIIIIVTTIELNI